MTDFPLVNSIFLAVALYIATTVVVGWLKIYKVCALTRHTLLSTSGSSRYYPVPIQVLTRYSPSPPQVHPGTLQVLSGTKYSAKYLPGPPLHLRYIQVLTRYYPGTIQVSTCQALLSLSTSGTSRYSNWGLSCPAISHRILIIGRGWERVVY